MPALLETVVNLNEALNHLHDLDQLLTGLPEDMQEVHEEHSSSKAEIERLEAIITEATSERRGAETATQDLAVKLQHFQDQVSRVKTQREYSAILQEIDLTKENTRQLEDQVLEAMERQEEAEGTLDRLRLARSSRSEIPTTAIVSDCSKMVCISDDVGLACIARPHPFCQ